MTLLGVPVDAEPSPEMWSAAGIPPAALWIKDLVMWGTLDPVAAYALSRRLADSRPDTEALASSYYDQLDVGELGDPLDPAAIRSWAAALQVRRRAEVSAPVPSGIAVRLSPRITDPVSFGRWRVVPLVRGDRIDWADVAGFVLAASEPLSVWNDRLAHDYDFVLNAAESVVESVPYL